MKAASLSLLVVGLLVATSAVEAQPSAREIVERSDQLLRGRTQTATQTMTIVRPGWERSMRFEAWSEGTERSFIRILEPARERGTTFLKIDRELWQYVPRVNRVIKIPPSMMLQSWMGSDFTNDDLVRESSAVRDYTHTLLRQERIGSDQAYVIEMQPRAQAAVAWDRVVQWIRVGDYMPLRAEFFNERGQKVRTFVFSDIREVGGRRVPTRTELIEETRPGHRTVIILEQATFDRPIPASVFTQQNLRRGG
jgi:outer membrane lipoprotein-sorting protein